MLLQVQSNFQFRFQVESEYVFVQGLDFIDLIISNVTRKPIDRNLPSKIESTVLEAKLYTYLQAQEKKLDALVTRKELELQDSLVKSSYVKKTLRVFVSNLILDVYCLYKIVQYVHALHNAIIKRNFFYGFSSKPTEFLESWIGSQRKDFEVC
ncbi:SWI/SNF and RSC complex subunit Ssr3 [Basidiobolus ranarum]|uniref:SWI/SNF and RSC complex subunit Ssr3 n=1 Tax=Basidiobolus ranarum TaxID=34480 RepID=A0ABR2VQP7_9FUNG